jgi:hypothetical protein
VRKHVEKQLQEGDVVSVKDGTNDPDFGDDIGGWRGRIDDIYEDAQGTPLVMIEWDSVTLKNMSMPLLLECQRLELDWDKMVLEVSDIKSSDSRDTEEDVVHEKQKIHDALAQDRSYTHVSEKENTSQWDIGVKFVRTSCPTKNFLGKDTHNICAKNVLISLKKNGRQLNNAMRFLAICNNQTFQRRTCLVSQHFRNHHRLKLLN